MNGDFARVSRNCLGRHRLERASTDTSTSRIGRYSNADDSLWHHRHNPKSAIYVVVFNPKDVLRFQAKQPQTIKAVPPPSVIIHNKCGEPSPYTTNAPSCESVGLVQCQPHVDRLPQISSHLQVTQDAKARLTENWQNETTVSGNHKDCRDMSYYKYCPNSMTCPMDTLATSERRGIELN